MEFERVLNGIVRYVNDEVYVAMNDWQEMIARIAVSRVIGSKDSLKQAIANNGFLRTFAVIDGEGNIDVDSLLDDIRKQIEAKGSLKLTIPLMPTMTFTAKDVDKLKDYIMRG
jgi:hypothetical protein